MFKKMTLTLLAATAITNEPVLAGKEEIEGFDDLYNQATTLPVYSKKPDNQGKEEVYESNSPLFNYLPAEVLFWKIFLPYLPKNGMLVNKRSYQAITGYESYTEGAVAYPPASPLASYLKVSREKFSLGDFTPETIPSLTWSCLIKQLESPSQDFWSFLPGTNIHTLNLAGNEIGSEGASALASVLPYTKVHTVNLWCNRIGDEGASALASVLPNTNVHTVNLVFNYIGDEGARALASVLPNTDVHTLNLRDNRIGSEGASALASVLPNTSVHTVDLQLNPISNDAQEELRENYSNIDWRF